MNSWCELSPWSGYRAALVGGARDGACGPAPLLLRQAMVFAPDLGCDEMAEAAGSHLGLADLQQVDDRVGAEAVARVDEPAAIVDPLAPGGLLGTADQRARPGMGLALVPSTAGHLVGQCAHLATNERCWHEIAHGGVRQQQPQIALTIGKRAEPTMVEKLLQLAQTQLPEPGCGEVPCGANKRPPLPAAPGALQPQRHDPLATTTSTAMP